MGVEVLPLPEDNRLRSVFFHHAFEFLRSVIKRLIPTHPFPLAFAPGTLSNHGITDSLRIVQQRSARTSLGAKSAFQLVGLPSIHFTAPSSTVTLMGHLTVHIKQIL
jgi:hypothetical protein